MHKRCKLQAYTKPPHTSSALLFKFSDQSLLNTLSWPYISETLCVWLSCLNEHTDFSHHKLWILTGGFGFASPPPPFNIHYYHNTNKSLINANDSGWKKVMRLEGFLLPPETFRRERLSLFRILIMTMQCNGSHNFHCLNHHHLHHDNVAINHHFNDHHPPNLMWPSDLPW